MYSFCYKEDFVETSNTRIEINTITLQKFSSRYQNFSDVVDVRKKEEAACFLSMSDDKPIFNYFISLLYTYVGMENESEVVPKKYFRSLSMLQYIKINRFEVLPTKY